MSRDKVPNTSHFWVWITDRPYEYHFYTCHKVTHESEDGFGLAEGSTDAQSCDEEDCDPTDDKYGSTREEMVTGEEGVAASSVNEVATDGNKGQSYQLRGKRGLSCTLAINN